MFGQDRAIDELATAIKLSRAGLRPPDKPIGSYLFTGPTGVGKTEVAKQLAKTMGIELIRFDMSEYMERHTVSRLIGAPPGYVGYDRGGLLDRGRREDPARRALARRNRKGAPRRLQRAAAGDGPRHAHGQQRQEGRFPARGADHDQQRRRARSGAGPAGFRQREQPRRRRQGVQEHLQPRVPQSPGRAHSVRSALSPK